MNMIMAGMAETLYGARFSYWGYLLAHFPVLGLLKTGAHPTLAGVVLGLMTPVFVRPSPVPPLMTAQTAMRKASEQMLTAEPDPQHLLSDLRTAQLAQRDHREVELQPALALAVDDQREQRPGDKVDEEHHLHDPVQPRHAVERIRLAVFPQVHHKHHPIVRLSSS